MKYIYYITIIIFTEINMSKISSYVYYITDGIIKGGCIYMNVVGSCPNDCEFDKLQQYYGTGIKGNYYPSKLTVEELTEQVNENFEEYRIDNCEHLYTAKIKDTKDTLSAITGSSSVGLGFISKKEHKKNEGTAAATDESVTKGKNKGKGKTDTETPKSVTKTSSKNTNKHTMDETVINPPKKTSVSKNKNVNNNKNKNMDNENIVINTNSKNNKPANKNKSNISISSDSDVENSDNNEEVN